MRAHLAELHRQFQAARQPPLYGRDLVWPLPPAVLQPFQDTCHALFCRYAPWAIPSLFTTQLAPTEHLDLVIRTSRSCLETHEPHLVIGKAGAEHMSQLPTPHSRWHSSAIPSTPLGIPRGHRPQSPEGNLQGTVGGQV